LTQSSICHNDPWMTYTPSHVGICVSDLDRSIRFYRDGLGFELSDRFDLDAAKVPDLGRSLEIDDATTVVSQMIVNGPMKVELLHYPSRPVRGTPSTSRGLLGLTHLSFIVEDVDDAATRLVEHGGTILPDTRVNVGVDIVFLTDPDGTRIELMTA
jgi:catechol 2,3-dioxygenase-like lactoylglutathione lyase family enzyme